MRRNGGSSAKVLSLVGSPAPSKTTVVQMDQTVVSKPVDVELALMTFWSHVECWPEGVTVLEPLASLPRWQEHHQCLDASRV